ncbi:MAG: hypothetical protein BWY64_01212 [bacterium ADurb.Bin363]|nr:MAG: hypothetical protein BWY64_01212 [bacterium ADurb.Bin363]
MSRLSNLRGEILEVISSLAWGYKPIGQVGTKLLPFATIPKMQVKIPKYGMDAFRRYKTKRGLGADSNRMPVDDRNWQTVETVEHDAEFPIDYLEEKEANFDLQKHAAFRAKAAVEMELECEIATLLQTLSNYNASNQTTLTGADKWSDQEHSDPVSDIETGKNAIRSAIGMKPNTLLLGYQSYLDLKEHPALLDKIKYSMKGIITEELMKEIFDIKDIYIGESVYVADTGTTFTDLWSDNAILAYVPKTGASEEASVYEPAMGYTVRREGNPFVFQHQPHPKLTLVNYTDNFAPVLVGIDGSDKIIAGYIINDTH